MFRYVIEFPAWLHVKDIVVWGEYSRYADLSNGLFLFPVEAILTTLLLIIASLFIFTTEGEIKTVGISIYFATIFALMGLGFTILAAPYILSLRTMGNDSELLQHAFNRFHFWGFFRATVQISSFFCCIIGLARAFGIKRYKDSIEIMTNEKSDEEEIELKNII